MDLNKIYGKLQVMKFSHVDKFRHKHYLCKCDCGKEKIININSLKTGNTKSCGCIQRESFKSIITKHDMSRTRFFGILTHMKQRCYNINHKKYHNYGGRGITICDSWLNSFDNFKDDMYESYLEHVEKFGEKNTSIDRIDPDGNYELNNCRWATSLEQRYNSRDIKYFLAKDPDNVLYVSKYQKIFAEQHNLAPNKVSACILKKQNHHKCWKFRHLTEDEITLLTKDEISFYKNISF